MFNSKNTILALMLVVNAVLIPAHAILFTGTTTGSWVNPIGTTGFTIANNDGSGGDAIVNWGTPETGSFSNQFLFDGAGSDSGSGWSANDGDAFLIGDFEYRNGAVSGQDFTGIDLMVALNIVTPLSTLESFTFDFDVTNTPNSTGDDVLDGDIVTVINPLNQTIFNYSGTDYTLELLGLSSDGGNTIRSDFSSPENATATAGLYAQITTAPVPEPSILALMSFGLVGLGFARRRQS